MRTTRWRWLLAAFSALLAACAAGGGDPLPPGAPDAGSSPLCDEACRAQAQPPGCVSSADYFAQVAWPTVVNKCVACHVAGGAAGGTRYVLENPALPDAMTVNAGVFAQAAKLEEGGRPLLLLKPTAAVPHGGGQVVVPGSREHAVLAEMLTRSLAPVTCPSPEPDSALTRVMRGVTLLDGYGTLRKAAIQLAGRLPTEAEIAAVDAGGEAALDPLLAAMMQEPAYFQRLREIFNDVLLTDAFDDGNGTALLVTNDMVDRTTFPEGARYQNGILYSSCTPGTAGCERPSIHEIVKTGNALAREPLEFFVRAAKEDLPLTEVLTARYRLVNAWTAKLFGLAWDGKAPGTYDPDQYASDDFRPTRIPGLNENVPGASETYAEYAGILTTNAYRARYPNTCTNNNRKIARYTYKYFQDFDIMKSAPRLDLSNVDLSQHPSRTNVQCTGCHTQIDPVAGAFQNWTPCNNAMPRYYPPSRRANCGADGWKSNAEMFPPGVGSGDENALPREEWPRALEKLSDHLVAQPGFVAAMVRHVFTGLTGRPLLEQPPDPLARDYAAANLAFHAQQEVLASLGKAFTDGGMKLSPLVRAVVKTPYFRAADADVEGRAELASMGGGVWTPPEVLDRKLAAIFGQGWEYLFQDSHGESSFSPDHGRSMLTRRDRLRLFDGGIDSKVVLTRQRVPSGLASAVIERMASELSCLHVARDFLRPPSQRRLFAGVEITDVPAGNAGDPSQAPIVDTLVRLHERFLGERLGKDDPELLATYGLFREAYATALASRGTDGPLPKVCAGTFDPRTGVPTAGAQPLPDSAAPLVRAWQAVVVYLLTDYRFLFQ